ncbi:chorismate mutase [Micromonospora musae]|uniref:chorismate mutase n=1 Tax=Micromonospora musae TaxID=1894970 RepID=UPI0033F4A44A
MTDVVQQNGGSVRGGDEAPDESAGGQPASSDAAESSGAGRASGRVLDAGTQEPMTAARIREIRTRIDEIDQAIIGLWQERAGLSQEVGAMRRASGGTRLVLSREREILEHFRAALGPDGTQLALLLLRAGRGPL